MNKTMVELFAGVGGVRLGFERLQSGWKTVWFSQWEPSMKKQWAHECYVKHFGDCVDNNGEYHTNDDITIVDKNTIPTCSLLVSSHPCQNFSVASTLAHAKGLEGDKGILWWQIVDILKLKRPPFYLFENVDRMIKSPAKQRGRDFGVILKNLSDLNYSVEWRIVNASDYGAGQRRRRIFVFAYQNNTNYAKQIRQFPIEKIFLTEGFMAKSFPVMEMGDVHEINIFDKSLETISKDFKFDFSKAGYMTNGCIYTTVVEEQKETSILLGDLLEETKDKKYFITDKQKLAKWKYLKGAKKIARKAKNGYEYTYSEGPVAFPDAWDKPGRTMLTSEGTVNRSSHVVENPGNRKLRILLPIEAERLQGFDDNWTNTGMSDRMRYFCMGNALVVPMITRMGKVLDSIVEKER